MRRIKVQIVDDSAVVRQVLAGVLNADPGIEVIHTAADPLIAMERMSRQWPDVIVLDIEMPRMDGITFLRKIMRERPTPVVICSTLTARGARATLDALAAGAFTIVTKPSFGLKQFLYDAAADLTSAVRAAAGANAGLLAAVGQAAEGKAAAGPTQARADDFRPMANAAGQVVAIGTSTGGTQALEAVLSALPQAVPGIVIVQHMPEKFTAAFAERLDRLCRIAVREARHDEPVLPGQALIAPGGKHMLLVRRGLRYHVDVVDGPLVSRHRPSVDVLFRSVARCAGPHALGIIMTGMGNDGAAGLLEMRNSGARTIAQDEASCVVYGMPKEAVKLGAAERVLPLSGLAFEIAQAHRAAAGAAEIARGAT